MSEKEGENTALYVIGVLCIVVVGLMARDFFRKPAPREHATVAVATPAAQTNAAQPAANGDTGMSFNPKAVMEDPEFADIAPKLPPGVKVPDRLPMPRNPVDQMRAALKALILSQEIYMVDNGFTRYSSNINELKEMPVIPGVTVSLRGAGPVGYVAIARHAKVPKKTCALYVGTPPIAPAKVTGTIGCD